MKKILILLVIVVATLTVAPRFIGATAEEKIRELYQQANQNPAWNFEIVEYNRGWFSSQLKVDISLDATNLPTADHFKISLIHDMQHGPLLWKTGGIGVGLVDTVYGIELPVDIQAELGEHQQVVSATSRMDFDGSNISILKINPFSIDKDQNKIDVLAGKFITDIDLSGHISMNGNWKGMSLKSKDNTNVELTDLSIDMEQTSINGEIFGPNALFEGDMEMLIKSIKSVGPEAINIENFSIKSTSQFRDDVADFFVFFGIDKLSIPGQEFTELNYDIGFENFSKESLLELQEVLSEGNNAIDPTQTMQKLQSLVPKLLEKNPVLKVNHLGMKTSSGEIDSTATISISKDKYDPKNLMSLMMAVDAVANGFAPEAFFTGLGMDADVNALVQQNFLVRDGDQLKFNASFKNGQALLNGTSIPLGM